MIILHPPIQCILGDRIVTCDAGTSYLFSSFEMNSYRVLFSSANNILQNLLVTIFIYVTFIRTSAYHCFFTVNSGSEFH
jgi:hypothetical protein